MPDLSESEILSRHTQALQDARILCNRLCRNADPEYLAPRGHLYSDLKVNLNALEGTARQMAHYRADARWLKLGIFYAKIIRGAQAAFVGQRWRWFGDLIKVLDYCAYSHDELCNRKTGRLSSSPIIPANPSAFLMLPNHTTPRPPPIPKSALN